MVRRKRKAKDSIFDRSHEDNIPAETAAAEIDASNSVIADTSENNVLIQSEYEEHAIEETEKDNNATSVGCSKMDKSKIDTAEEEYMDGKHASEVETQLGEAKEAEEGKEEECDDCDDDNTDDDDVDNQENDNDDDFDDDDDEGSDDDDFYEDDDYDDYDDEKDDIMEEEEIDEIAKLENDDNIVEESDDGLKITLEEGKQEGNAEEENEDREVETLKKEVKTLMKRSKRKKAAMEILDEMASKNEDRQEEDGQGDALEEGDQENAEEEKEDREGGSLKKKAKSLRKKQKRKKVTQEVSDKMASNSKDKQEEDHEGEGNAKEDIRDKEGHSKQKVNKLSKSSRRKVAAGGTEKVASKQDDKREALLRRKRSSKKVESMGMIFMCSSKTKKDCYHYKVLGLPANKRDLVAKVYKGMRLFLYDVDLKLMYGIYKAAGPGGYNIQPKAFNYQFPSQVRFTVIEDCLPLAEEKFKKVIKDNYFTKTKFDCQLTSQQVKNLCKLFVSASKGSKAIRSAKRVRTHASTDQDRSRARGVERQSAMDEKRHRHYHERDRKREREVVASPLAPVPHLLLPSAAPTPYVYSRTLELDAYRRDLFAEHPGSHRHPVLQPHDSHRTIPSLDHRDVYRREPPFHHIDSYRRDVAVEHLDLRSLDEIRRGDPYISYRERAKHPGFQSRDDFGRPDPYFSYRGIPEDHNLRSQGETGRLNPYISYREVPADRGRFHDTGLLPSHDNYHPISRSTLHDSAVAALPEYSFARLRYRY